MRREREILDRTDKAVAEAEAQNSVLKSKIARYEKLLYYLVYDPRERKFTIYEDSLHQVGFTSRQGKIEI